MSTSVRRPMSFNVTLFLKDGRQFNLSDVRSFYSWVRLELTFYDGTQVDILFSKIDRFNFTVLFDAEVVPFDLVVCDYGVCEFADYIFEV